VGSLDLTPIVVDASREQMHVSLAGPGQMKVTWVTASEVPASVQYGKTSGQFTKIASGVTKQYSYIFYESDLIHHVILGPLEPSTIYFYRCGGFGPEYNFTTPPAGPNVPIKFAVVGEFVGSAVQYRNISSVTEGRC
jgi:hypothetical protein